jgi:UDP-2-acetamido-2,6-beta-L-arabino-hexul-4-ose reductase
VKFAITGAAGFLGWHARCAIQARGDEFVSLERPVLEDADRFAAAVSDADTVLHFAGINRGDPHELRDENLGFAQKLTAAIDTSGSNAHVVYANSIQAGNGTPFGDGKQDAAKHFSKWSKASGIPVADVRLPNLFGEHGRPGYNSVVATFCHELATGGLPVIQQDRELPLLHVQDALDGLFDLADQRRDGGFDPEGRPTSVSALLDLLQGFRDLYATGDIPVILDPLHLALFNTYRSYCFPELFPIYPPLRADDRGHLFECTRSHGGQAHTFCSTSHAGITRGDHFHRRKVERFMVLSGTAEITLRKLFDDKIVRFQVSGEKPSIVDMPTMWAHAITNTGSSELMTLFWAHEILDPLNPDTYPEPVESFRSAPIAAPARSMAIRSEMR